MKITKWKIHQKEVVLTAHVFRYQKVKSESPTTNQIGDFDVVQCLNWVNVIAFNEKNECLLVKQYRHGIEDVTIEIPGGAVHHGEDPLLAAKRELREETGHSANRWVHLGRVDANPAFMNNACDTYLALGAIKTHELELDPFEEIEVIYKTKSEIKNMILSREITHSLVVAAFYLFEFGCTEA